jgi:hypothetical protein
VRLEFFLDLAIQSLASKYIRYALPDGDVTPPLARD